MPRGTQDPSAAACDWSSTGLSPATVARSNAFEWSQSCRVCWSYNPACSLASTLVWALPVSLATTTGISFDFSSSGY